MQGVNDNNFIFLLVCLLINTLFCLFIDAFVYKFISKTFTMNLMAINFQNFVPVFQIFNTYIFQILIFIFQWFILNIDTKFCWPKRILWPPLPPAKGFTNMHSNYFDFFMCSSTRNTAFANISGPPAIFCFSGLARQLIWTLSSVPMKLFFAKRENRGDLKCDNFSIYRDISSFYVCLGNITGLKFSYMQVTMMAVGEIIVCQINHVLHTHTHKKHANQAHMNRPLD